MLHRARVADPRHQLLLPRVLDLGHRELLPLGLSPVANLLGSEPVALDVSPVAGAMHELRQKGDVIDYVETAGVFNAGKCLAVWRP